MQSLRTRTRTAFKSYPHATQGSDCTRAVAVRAQHSDYFCWRSWLATRRARSVCFYPSRVLLCLCLCMLRCVFFVSISSKATRTHLIDPPWRRTTQEYGPSIRTSTSLPTLPSRYTYLARSRKSARSMPSLWICSPQSSRPLPAHRCPPAPNARAM